jgi:hypothetical protein
MGIKGVVVLKREKASILKEISENKNKTIKETSLHHILLR